jgi:hypothetical protein
MAVRLMPDAADGLGVAFNEATWLGAEIDVERRVAGITLAVRTLPPVGPPPVDRRLQVLLHPVGRVWVRRTSHHGEILTMSIGELLPTVQSFGGCPIYGWEFFDTPVPALHASQLSALEEFGTDGLSHTLHLFQDGGVNGQLDLWVWFDELTLRTPEGAPLPIDDVIAGGRRWWDGLHAGDPRTADAGIFPLKGGAR